jgi:hypothetical protein
MSDLESEFLNRWQQFAPASPQPEHDADDIIPGRKHRADFLWRGQRVIVEMQGGAYSRGRHTRGAGYEGDCEKLNLLVAQGYRVFWLTRGMIRADPIRWVSLVRESVDPLPFTDFGFDRERIAAGYEVC